MPMKTINFIFGCHAHQPVGNFDFVFERAYNSCYRPFLDLLERFPDVRMTMHITGPLFDWFESNVPTFVDRLGAMVTHGQVELMGGGYYEPLLCAIPQRDAIRQLERMQRYCEQRFGVKPRGAWLAERVWEPHMAGILEKAGIEYTALDDSHFLCSGMKPEQLFGYYLTEDGGLSIKIFPILEKLRYLVPFHTVEETIECLSDHATESGDACAVLHDDYEKFGVWPGTNKSVYQEGWLERFFKALSENKSWLRCCTYSEYLDTFPGKGRTYITCASYDEMMTWALPTEMQRSLINARNELKLSPELFTKCSPFMRGGFWRNFLAKYDESNNIQKRMLMVSRRLSRLSHSTTTHDPRMEEAERLLHQGQCNCAYWHGVFGGLYLNHLRTALYEKLIAADVVLDGLETMECEGTRFISMDFDGDGNQEGILVNRHVTLFFDPSDGGTLFEWDYKEKPFNFGNVLTRRDEVYHDQIRQGCAVLEQGEEGTLSIHELVKVKEQGLERYLVYDPWRRVSLRDRFFSPAATAEMLWSGIEPELGGFARSVYTMTEDNTHLLLSAQASVLNTRAALDKRVSLNPKGAIFEVHYSICFDNEINQPLLFGTEWAFNLLTGNAHDRYYWSRDTEIKNRVLGSIGRLESVSHIAARDEWQGLEVEFVFYSPATVYRFPIDTVSQSEDGQERVHQGCVLIPCWDISNTKQREIKFHVAIHRIGTRS